MGTLHNETYLMPKVVGTRLDEPKLKALIADLIRERVVMKPYLMVTGKELPLPFTVYSPLGNLLLDGKPPPRGMRVMYRGEDAKALLAALSKRADGDVLVYFADMPPFHDDIPEERPHAVLLYALSAPREIALNQTRFDENLNEIPNSESAGYRVCNAAVVLGTGIDSPKYHPVRNLSTVLAKHLGAIDEQFDILH